MSSGDSETVWEKGWEGHEEQQLRRLARLPFVEKRRWLEGAHHLMQHLSNARMNDMKREKAPSSEND